MIFHAACFDGLHFILPGDAAEERPEPFAQVRRDKSATFLGAEEAMEIGTNVGHGAIQPSLWDFGNSKPSRR